jgi:predicted amidophosphoribosyltransferase
MDTIEEKKYRNDTICPGCGKPKDTGLVVCWTCWSHTDNPFKYFQGDIEEWLKSKKII